MTTYAEAIVEIVAGNKEMAATLGELASNPSEIVDKIKFYLRTMHLNNENDHYMTLLLPPGASKHEVSRRWKLLMRLYHPDRKERATEEELECAKRINDAYSILKDETRKTILDQSLAQKAYYMAKSERIRSGDGKAARRLRKAIIPSCIVICLAVIMTIIYSEKKQSFVLEQSLYAKKDTSRTLPADADQNVQAKADAKRVPLPSPPVRQDVKDEGQEKSIPAKKSVVTKAPLPAATEKALPGKVVDSPPQKPLSVKKEQPALPQPVKPQPVVVAKASPPASTSPAKPEPAGKVVEAPPQPVPPKKVAEPKKKEPVKVAVAAQTSLPSAPPAKVLPIRQEALVPQSSPQAKPQETIAGKAEKKTLPPPPPVEKPRPAKESPPQDTTQREVNVFIQQYTRAYEEGDVDRFLRFYSPTVKENNKLDFNAIRSAYKKNFENNSYRYTLTDMKFERKGDLVHINGVYSLTKMKGDDTKPIRGAITWVLRKEEGALKIVRVDYKRVQ